ncbi:histidine phosphatase family protein [Primorskyibacter sp. S87]|uniref:histidine phosphatase family protein n=1 Tax=Primorskyibacter sp. S87 TaxID=3415126 RepID=UPI003C7BB900
MTHEYRQSVYAPPQGAVDLLLIRHGESAAVQPGVSFPMQDGQGNPELHPNGRAQARAVAERLGHERFDALYVTPLQRTHQTAAPLAERLGMEPFIEADLREVHLGEWDNGEYRIRVAEGDPALKRARDRQEWGEIPGAETTAALHERVRSGLLRIAAAHPDQRVAAFVHQGVIGAAMAMACGAEPFAFNRAANGSISRLVIKQDRMTVLGFNDCSHL